MSPRPAPPAPEEIWREFHWAFFINVQGLIIGLKRFTRLLEEDRLAEAARELDCAAELLIASAAAMELAGSFPREAYQERIRVSMTPPAVRSDAFSGLMSWEHGVLVEQFRRLRPAFAELPEALVPAHGRFVEAYRRLATGHSHVCTRFVGGGAGSLRSERREAAETLRRFAESRLALIDPAPRAAEPPARPERSPDHD
ncbi:siderophore biosynthesis protein [Oceanicella sp. SM1341]|uniref:siderophore biosynthesis protein n=1 Tax=Oceanicella sp. SM1341 TaxID=1548889 RepID=UPI000E495D54|nr:siderophore biosynthesis protein [Oceanicella sp. SM1341]